MKKWSIFLLAASLAAIVFPIVDRVDAQSVTPTWNQYCFRCHGSASSFGPRTVTQINNAISNVGEMASLSTLTAAQRKTISNELSGITGVTITITAPIARQVIPSGQQPFTITYDAPPEVSSVKVKYSLNNGATWLSALGTQGTGTFDWDVPTPVKNTTKALLKVIGFDASSTKLGSGKSDAFTIEVVSITAPAADVNVPGGTPDYLVTWTTNGTKNPVASAKVFYTFGSNGIWKSANGLVLDPLGSFSWNVPSPATTKIAKLKVVLKDDSGVTVGIAVSKAFVVQ